ncbi:acid stress response protein YqgB [Enterobacter sp. PGRG2]|uniref:acid stress response protein YqgB n=1 Tax=Enterobacter sp. PGRG2 TaxID=3104013 RepID=UPI0039F5E649
MNKKPVAQSAYQHSLLATLSVYGLLSLCYAAIVVNCFISTVFRAARVIPTCGKPNFTGYTLSTMFEVRYV